MTDRRSDLQADLLADLQGAAAARTLPSDPHPVAPVATEAAPATPALALELTPLRWSLPSVAATGTGLGLALRVGPLGLSISLG